jgi:hypothetical protein
MLLSNSVECRVIDTHPDCICGLDTSVESFSVSFAFHVGCSTSNM